MTTLQLFGAYRRYAAQNPIEIELGNDATVAQLRVALKQYAQVHWPTCDPRLIDATAFSTDTDVLQDGDVIESGSVLSALPPVSGG